MLSMVAGLLMEETPDDVWWGATARTASRVLPPRRFGAATSTTRQCQASRRNAEKPLGLSVTPSGRPLPPAAVLTPDHRHTVGAVPLPRSLPGESACPWTVG